MADINIDDFVKPIQLGGTGGSTPQEAATNLGLVTASDAGKPLGYIALDAMKEPEVTEIQDKIPVVLVSLLGPSYVMLNERVDFTIVNYDAFAGYSLLAINGAVERNGKIITYTAPTMVGRGGFIINGNRFELDVLETLLKPPVFITPVADSINNTPRLTLETSPFEPIGVTDTHVASDLEVSYTPDFSEVAYRFQNDTVNLTSFYLGLFPNKTYYARARYHGQVLGPSRWSNPIKFKTSAQAFVLQEMIGSFSDFGQSDLRFAASLAATPDGSYLVVAADNWDGSQTNQGHAQIFKRVNNAYTKVEDLSIPVAVANARFGYSVAISDDASRVFIAAPYDKVGTTVGAGSVYVFKKDGAADNWPQEARLVPSVIEGWGSFGISIDCNADGSVAFIGAPGYTGTGGEANAGAAFIFTRAGVAWTEKEIIRSQSQAASGNFGFRVAASGDGTFGAISATGERKVTLVRKEGSAWVSATVINQPINCENFGRNLKIARSNNMLAISGHNYGGVLNKRGMVYTIALVADVDGLISVEPTSGFAIVPGDLAANDNFGSALAFTSDGTKLFVGCEYDDIGGFTNCGSFYVFEKAASETASYYLKAKGSLIEKQDGARVGCSLACNSDGTLLILGALGQSGGEVTNSGAFAVMV